MKKNNGFTLAEVLITIGILGLIAAMTLPALMYNVEKGSWMSSLKSNKSLLERGFAQMLAENYADTLDIVPLWDNINNNADKQMKKYFKVEKIGTGRSEKIYNLNNTENSSLNNTKRYELPNSAFINISFKNAYTNSNCNTITNKGGNICENFASIYVDTNGKKRPNVIGKDIYYFYLSKDGKLFPFGGDDINYLESGSPKWDTEEGCKGNLDVIKDSRACTARVMDNGYDIDY